MSVDISFEKLGDGVRRITRGYGADIVIVAALLAPLVAIPLSNSP